MSAGDMHGKLFLTVAKNATVGETNAGEAQSGCCKKCNYHIRIKFTSSPPPSKSLHYPLSQTIVCPDTFAAMLFGVWRSAVCAS